MRKSLAVTAALGLIGGTLGLAATPAGAQMWIGLMVGNMMAQELQAKQEHQCMMGDPLALTKIDETRGPTAVAIATYWAAAAAPTDGVADVRAAFNLDSRASWTGNGRTLSTGQLDRVADPIASAAAALRPAGAAPVLLASSYFRSGDGRTVAGRWTVSAADGRPLGGYDATFIRTLGKWQLRSLILLAADDASVAPVQYCHKPGDVMPYRTAFAISEAKRAAKRAAKEAARAAERARLEGAPAR